MKRMLLAGSLLVAVLALAAPSAFGVLPKKNGVYVGDIKSSPFSMHVSLAVGSTGQDGPLHVPLRNRPCADDDQRPRRRRQGLLQVRVEPDERPRLEARGPLPHADDRPDLAQLDRLRRLEGGRHREAEVSRW